MKHKLLCLFMATALAACMITGCGSSEKTEPVEETQEAVTETEAEEAGFTDGEEAVSEEESVEEATEETQEEAAEETETTIALDTSSPLTGIHHAAMEIRDYGTITLELDADTAPISVTNFVKLVQDGFYDGLTFHRIIDGFMMQGGDPLGNGTGGSEEKIKGEFDSNGVENKISHVKGTLSMARAADPDSASSQFFIVQTDSVFLDGDYAGFGHVTEGLEIVDQICADAEPTDQNGTISADQQPVIEKIVILD